MQLCCRCSLRRNNQKRVTAQFLTVQKQFCSEMRTDWKRFVVLQVESNIGRFLKMQDQFVDQSQFVIVTHNKRTMNRADVMYGVTMEEFGVSKPVGMKMADERTTNVKKIDAIQ